MAPQPTQHLQQSLITAVLLCLRELVFQTGKISPFPSFFLHTRMSFVRNVDKLSTYHCQVLDFHPKYSGFSISEKIGTFKYYLEALSTQGKS